MQRTSFYIINSITLYRLLASLLLLFFILENDREAFKWLLLLSFFTDAIDGFLARWFRVTSILGSRIDSIADDLTILMAIIGLLVWKPEFIWQEHILIFVLGALYLIQLTLAIYRYGSISSFHTYTAKVAAVFQGVFFLLVFFLPEWPSLLFYLAAFATILDLIEEIILVLLLPQGRTDVKGLYWVLKQRSRTQHPI